MSEYFTADTYKNYERIGEPFLNDSGKLSTKIRYECPRCGGLGLIISRVENNVPIPIPVDNGICFQCLGKKFITKEVRLYTKVEYDRLQKNKERTKERKEAKMLAEAEGKRNTWLEKNGFDKDGYTYILIGLDTYAIKNELKDAGWRYNSFLRWHNSSPANYENNVYKMHWKEAYSSTAWGDMNPLPDIQKRVDELIEGPKSISTSEWIGEAGDRIDHILVTLVSVKGFMGKYGYSTAVKFKTEKGDTLTWFTQTEIKITPGNKCYLSGTIKKLDEYKGEKITVLTRCKLKAE